MALPTLFRLATLSLSMTTTQIYVMQGWTGTTPAELSMLVHEMVHHLQSSADMRFACPGNVKVMAYSAQDAWLNLFGESLEGAFGIDKSDAARRRGLHVLIYSSYYAPQR